MKTINKITILILIGLSSNLSSTAQEKIIDRSFNTWWSNINKYHLSEKWYATSEIHVRRADGIKNWQQFLFRPAINYALRDNVHLSAGYTYIRSYPYGNQAIAIKTPENNFWEQLTFTNNIGQLKLSHRYRLEHRFIGKSEEDENGDYHINGHQFAQRFRYRLTGTFPIFKSKKWFAHFFDEFWVNLDDNLIPLSMDQNWLYGGLGLKISKKCIFEIGYMNQLIRKGDGIHYENNDTMQMTLGYEFGKF